MRPTTPQVWRRLQADHFTRRNIVGQIQPWFSAVLPADSLTFQTIGGDTDDAQLLIELHATRIAGSPRVLYIGASFQRTPVDPALDDARQAWLDLTGVLILDSDSLRTAVARRALAERLLKVDDGRVVLDGALARFDDLFTTTPAIVGGPGGFADTDDLSDVSNVHALAAGVAPSRFARTCSADLVFNAAFFAFIPEDAISEHTVIGRPFGLQVEDGLITNPPYARRAAIARGPNGWVTARPSLANVVAAIGSTTTENPSMVMVDPSDHSQVEGQYILLGGGCRIVAIERDTAVVPQDGFAIVVNDDSLGLRLTEELSADNAISWSWLGEEAWDRAIQSGPLLVEEGNTVVSRRAVQDSEGIVEGAWQLPTAFDTRTDIARAGRVGLGILPDGDLLLLAASGVRPPTNTDAETEGITLDEFADEFVARGAIAAVNLDGGGSTAAVINGTGWVLPNGNRHGIPGVGIERPVPSFGVVRCGQ